MQNVISNEKNGENVSLINVKKKKISGTASEIRNLLRIFPIAVAHVIKDSDDDVWQMILHFRKISLLVSAPGLSFGQIVLLKASIDEYLKLRIKCFPSIPLRPKHHFIVHYPYLIPDVGPLKYLSTLRMESKHKFFKSLIKKSQNFKNVTKMLSEKHQLMECLHTYAIDKVQIHEGAEYNSTAFSQSLFSIIKTLYESNSELLYYICTKVSFRGITYSENMTICIGVDKYGNFEICKIKFIFINKNCEMLHFVGNRYSIYENNQLGCYELENNNHDEICLYSYENLLSPDPIPQTTVLCRVIFIPKYEPFYKDGN